MKIETLAQFTDQAARVQVRLVRFGKREDAYLDIRRHFRSKGRMFPTPKGVAIGADVYRTVREVLVEPTIPADRITTLMAEGVEETVELTPDWAITKVRVVDYKGTTYVDIRKFYETDDGSLRFSKKGVMLSLDDFKAVQKALIENDEAILEAMDLLDEVLADAA